jgi:hypothetical protein
MWPAQTAAIFFWEMLKLILKLLPIWISSVTQARFQQLIFYGLPDRNWHPFGKILASDVPGAFALNPQSKPERPPLKIFASCST